MKYVFVALSALSFVAASPVLAQELVVNGSFEQAATTSKTYFANAGVVGWSSGEGLTFLDLPGTADDGSYLSVYGPFARTSPDGGNFVEADGDPNYRVAISQTIAGLVVGQQYQLSFYQAAGQQQGFTGPTTERWQVSFGNQTQLSDLFSLPERGVGAWEAQGMTFTAAAPTQLLSFLAAGTPNGAPPISFLDGVSMRAVPEPASWAMMVAGFGLLGATLRRRRRAEAAIA